MTDRNDNTALPPRPGETPLVPAENKGEKMNVDGVPFIIYINGQPTELSKAEALSVMAQITNVLIYLDSFERQGIK